MRCVPVFLARSLFLGSVLLGAAPLAAQSATDPAEVSFSTEALAQALTRLDAEGRLRVVGVPLFDGPTATLELARRTVFAPGARVVVRDGERETQVAPPRDLYLAGAVAGEPGSVVFLTVTEGGRTHGLVALHDRLFVVGEDTHGSARPLVVRQVDDSQLRASTQPFVCANDQSGVDLRVASRLPLVSRAAASAQRALRAPTTYAAVVAVETDYEFYARFGSTSGAASYVASLLGAISAIYMRDVDTELQVGNVYLYSGGAASDPWTATSPSPALSELLGYWNTNRTAVPRNTALFLSGKAMGGGVAYLSILCFRSYGYAVIGNISGSYNPGNPTAVWDLTATAHELCHNFGSDHTHCYSPPVDQCYGSESGCYIGSTSVPAGGGTIMSYCHLHPPTYSVNAWLGRAGFYGNQSERVNQTILAHDSSSDAAGCLFPPSGNLFADQFETGSTSAWSAASP